MRSWRWRVIFGVLLVLFAPLPLALFIESRQAEASPCSCTLFVGNPSPTNFTDGATLELGVKIIPSVDGSIRAIRFYKSTLMGSAHNVRLWLLGQTGSALATASSSGETASGWQEVAFATPVSVTAGNTYIASVTMLNNNYVATSAYFTSPVTNGPLTAPAGPTNGVFSATPGTYPATSGNNANYWIDVSFYDQTTPQITSVAPTNGSTNVPPGESVTATFDHNMDATTLTSSTFAVRDPDNNPVTGTISYTDSTKTVSFVATDGLALDTEYTATIEGGSGTVAKNAVGIALPSDYSWSFTTTATNACPCSLKERGAPTGSVTADDAGALELGVKVKPTTNGYITALRFYKPIISTETTHTGKIWSSTGSQLASVSFTNETDYGWQEARLSTPLQVNENQLYIISYGTTTAVYQATVGGVNSNLGSGYLVAYADNSSENAATGSGNRNGVFTATAGNYPATGSTNGSYYWVDAVFATASAPTYPLSVGVVQPTVEAYGVPRNQVITAAFNRALDGTTVTNSTFRLFDSGNNQVGGTGTYNAAKGMATFTPSSNLTYGERYTARISATVADQAGTTLGAEYSWSFTVGTQLSSTPTQGPGGPLLVITSTANKYSPYYAEILRTEGLNYFDVKDIATVDAATLNNYDAAVLAEMTLSQAQSDMLSNWVTAGGNLVAMRPDSKLSSLLGLTSAGTTRSNQYLLINTATTPGNGLVGETIQFKGTADNYTLNGATAVATFYSDASTSTSNPAVSTKAVGGSGGTAVAFSYDLAKSVIAQHQGNQAWAGQNRDGTLPTRTNDLFFGNMTGDVQPDWIDSSKFHIPQADEQQRLLANILTEVVKDKRPLPRFWYLPGDYEAAVIMGGDDHGLSNAAGTERILNNWLNESATNCSVIDWNCVRATHYVYTSSSLTNTRATQYYNLGFEIGDHVGDTCNNFTSFATLSSQYASDLLIWNAKYTGLPDPETHRYHCYIWNDWDSQMLVESANGMRYDLNYVAFPASWVGSKAPLMTGSGMNMRLTDADGDMVDVRQGVTNFDNTTASTSNITGLLDNAIGANGYYGIFGSHYDMSGDNYNTTLYNAVTSRNVPIISSKQALTWLDGHGSSTFSSVSGSAGLFTFTVNAAEGAHNLKAMLPIQDASGTLSTLTLGGNNVTYDTRTVKGVQYAVFSANPGAYTATYSDYDPNAGSGGGSSGGSSGSGSSSGGSSSTPATTKKSTTFSNEEATDATEETSPTTQSTTEDDKPKEREIVTTTNGGEDGNWPWIVWALLGFALGGIIWWIVFTIRRKNHSGV